MLSFNHSIFFPDARQETYNIKLIITTSIMSQGTKSEDESSKLADTSETQPSNNQNLIDPSSNVSDNANVDKSKADTASDLEQDKSKVIENENSAMDTMQINDDADHDSEKTENKPQETSNNNNTAEESDDDGNVTCI